MIECPRGRALDCREIRSERRLAQHVEESHRFARPVRGQSADVIKHLQVVDCHLHNHAQRWLAHLLCFLLRVLEFFVLQRRGRVNKKCCQTDGKKNKNDECKDIQAWWGADSACFGYFRISSLTHRAKRSFVACATERRCRILGASACCLAARTPQNKDRIIAGSPIAGLNVNHIVARTNHASYTRRTIIGIRIQEESALANTSR